MAMKIAEIEGFNTDKAAADVLKKQADQMQKRAKAMQARQKIQKGQEQLRAAMAPPKP